MTKADPRIPQALRAGHFDRLVSLVRLRANDFSSKVSRPPQKSARIGLFEARRSHGVARTLNDYQEVSRSNGNIGRRRCRNSSCDKSAVVMPGVLTRIRCLDT